MFPDGLLTLTKCFLQAQVVGTGPYRLQRKKDPPADCEALADVIDRLAAGSVWRQLLQRAAWRQLEENFSWAAIGRRYLETFKATRAIHDRG
jgi:glycosyltransferase involved in cell wall biosynthesis